MASATPSSSVEAPRKCILEHGFFCIPEVSLGERVKRMEDDDVHIASQQGLQFCKDNVFDHPRIRPILESFFESPTLGLYRSLGPSPYDYIFTCDPGSPLETLMVMIWSQGSRVTFWADSHRHWLDPVEAANSLLQVTRARLHRVGSKPVDITMDDGGFAILDDRVAFQVAAGTAITFAFGREETVNTWNPMELPRSLEPVVSRIQHQSLRMSVKYFEDG